MKTGVVISFKQWRHEQGSANGLSPRTIYGRVWKGKVSGIERGRYSWDIAISDELRLAPRNFIKHDWSKVDWSKSNREIQAQVGCSYGTVRTTRARMKQKQHASLRQGLTNQ